MQNKIEYNELLKLVQDRISLAHKRNIESLNTELLSMYYDIGKYISNAKTDNRLTALYVEKLEHDIKRIFYDRKNINAEDIWEMIVFCKKYNSDYTISNNEDTLANISNNQQKDNKIKQHIQQQLQNKPLPVDKLSWGQNVYLFNKVKQPHIRRWYMHQCIKYGWTLKVLKAMITSNYYNHRNKFTTYQGEIEGTCVPLQEMSEYFIL